MNTRKKIFLYLFLSMIVVFSFGYRLYENRAYSNEFFSIKLPKEYKIIKYNDSLWFIKNPSDKNFSGTISIYSKGDMTREKIIHDINQSNMMIKAFFNKNFIYKSNKKNEVDYFKTSPIDFFGLKKILLTLHKKGNVINISITYKEQNLDSLISALDSLEFKDFKEIKPEKTLFKKTLTQKEVLEDANELITKLQIHPDLYHSKSKEDIEKAFELLIKEIKTKENFERRETTFLFSKFISKIEDGHTSLFPDNYTELSLFPLRVNIRDGKIFINKTNLSNKGLIGKEITTINSTSSKEVLKNLMEIKNMDNNNIPGKEYQLSKSFSMSYFLSFGITEDYTVKTKDENGLLEEFKLKGVSSFNISDNMKGNNTFMVNSIENSSIILDFNNFSSQDFFTFKEKTIKFFNMIEQDKIKNLIIDNRENFGGSLSYLRFFYDYLNEKNPNCKNFKVYLLSGRASYSGGEEAPAYAKQINKAIITVGEPTSGGLQFGNPIGMQLKNTKNFINISSAYFPIRTFGLQTPDINVKIDPRLEAIGVDQVMDKVYELIENNK